MAETVSPSPLKSLVPARLGQWFITLIFPFLLVLLCVRLVMTPLFLQLIYNRSGFPADWYGFTTQDRLKYAPRAVDYLLNDADITYLSSQQFPDGTPLYNERELRHMHDVKALTRFAYLAAVVMGISAILTGAALGAYRRTRGYLRQGLLYGSVFTLALIVTIVIVAIVNWNFFFTGFHQLFFESGTWRFEYSDTLIRLFPEQFWFEAALAVGLMTVISAGLTFLLAGRWRPEYDILPDSA